MQADRLGHPSNNGNRQPVASSAMRMNGGAQIFTDSVGLQNFVKPREVTTDEIKAVIDEHTWGAWQSET